MNESGYREKALKELGKKCQECGSSENLVVHHKDKNRANNNIENLEVLCRSCHQSKSRKNSKNWGSTKELIGNGFKFKTRLYKLASGDLVYIPKSVVEDSQYPFTGGTAVQMRIHPDRERIIIDKGSDASEMQEETGGRKPEEE